MTPLDVFAGLDPPALWTHFSSITAIPRQSGQEKAIASYVAHWAAALGFPCRRDAAGNICVYVPPSHEPPGAKTVALQAHLDMVCVRSGTGASHPANGTIEVIRDGDWIVAPYSTLGADNGIGIATALCVAESEGQPHGPLELLFTVEEETTFKGADLLDPSLIHATAMLNLDAETWGVLQIACAGGAWTVLRWPAPAEPLPHDWTVADIVLEGLCGGHSGTDIGKSRLNAIKGIVRSIKRIPRHVSFRLCAIEGGDAFNSIPTHAHATIAFSPAQWRELEKHIAVTRSDLETRFAGANPDLSLSIATAEPQARKCWSEQTGSRLLDLLSVVPSGVIAMEQPADNLVETSNNLGTVVFKEEGVEVNCLSRSSMPSALEEVVESIECAARLAGADFAIIPPVVPPWRAPPDSVALRTVQACFRDLLHTDAKLVTVHAVAECGMIQQRIPGLEVVSLGPEIHRAHMVGERVNITSVGQFYALLSEVIQRLAE